MADLLRRARAVLQRGRAALRGARCTRRRPDGAVVERAVPVPGGVARTAHPAALRRPGRAWAESVPRTLWGAPERAEHALQRLRSLPGLRWVPVRLAREVRRRGHVRASGARARQ